MNAYSKLYSGARTAIFKSQFQLDSIGLCMAMTIYQLAHHPPDVYGLHGGSRVLKDDLDEADVVEWQRGGQGE